MPHGDPLPHGPVEPQAAGQADDRDRNQKGPQAIAQGEAAAGRRRRFFGRRSGRGHDAGILAADAAGLGNNVTMPCEEARPPEWSGKNLTAGRMEFNARAQRGAEAQRGKEGYKGQAQGRFFLSASLLAARRDPRPPEAIPRLRFGLVWETLAYAAG